MQDNARPHMARVSVAYLQSEGIVVLEWPARSPDLNTMKHVWAWIGSQESRQLRRPFTVQDLTRVIIHAWDTLSQETINSLILSVSRRCIEGVNSDGGHTHYLCEKFCKV